MVGQYVTRIHRQHSSVVTSVPKGVQQVLQLKSGDYLLWQVSEGSLFVQVCKVNPGGVGYAKDNERAGRENKGRRLRAKTGG